VAAADQLLVANPHNTAECWRITGNTRRHIQIDEYNFYHVFLNEPIVSVTAAWFDSIPIATG
jgi:hypothetical protein